MNIQPIPPVHRVTANTSRYESKTVFGVLYERHLPHFDWRVVKKITSPSSGNRNTYAT